jgi:hypothetical protein
MKPIEFGAKAQMIDPSSRTTRAVKNTSLTESIEYNFPKRSCEVQSYRPKLACERRLTRCCVMFQCIRTVNKYADPYLAGEIISSDNGRGEGTRNNYHPISASELNSSVIVGSACKRTVVNHENKVTLEILI